uniref:Uncharacterized protein n=1 Tax=Neospora caninum (strain Liverpool) TaxID=572307 RepID=A0A0F7UDT9_NEOCL|nr:TPA: hypothetical protein BN1204_038145 [Neospora caninum Liverpool]
MREMFSKLPAAVFLVDRRGVLVQANNEASWIMRRLVAYTDFEIGKLGTIRNDSGRTEKAFPVGFCLSDLWLPNQYELYELWTACVNSRAEVTKNLQLNLPAIGHSRHRPASDKGRSPSTHSWVVRVLPFASRGSEPFCCMFTIMDASRWSL